ncbi:hypothetical protein [Oleispirillum naphthae]|uniref:hypothetical protein n=1 Tax=Oleispirillum naphthae TaxID=2838853 RepID=UPI00308235B5
MAKKPAQKPAKAKSGSAKAANGKKPDRARLILRVADGDSDLLRILPFGLSLPFRGLALHSRNGRKTRLHRAVRKLYPFLQKLESAALGAEGSLIGALPLEAALKNDAAIERAIKVFEVAWQLDLIAIVGPSGQRIGSGKRTVPAGACGLSVDQAERIYVERAVRVIFAKNTGALERLPGEAMALDALPRLRILAGMNAGALGEVRVKLGHRFGAILTDQVDTDWLNALTHIKAFQMHALGNAFGPAATEILDWDPRYLLAFAQAFSAPEQIAELGLDLRLIRSPEALLAIGTWAVRDVTDKINEELNKRGRPDLRERQHETDIAVFRAMLGSDFASLVKQPAPIITAFGELLRNIRMMNPGPERSGIIEHIKTFCARYLDYMTPEALAALELSTEIEPDETAGPTIPEIVGIMNGIWGKPGLGRVFFEQHLQRKDGVMALRGLVDDYREMVLRGSIQRKQDIATIIITSTVLDRAIARYISA